MTTRPSDREALRQKLRVEAERPLTREEWEARAAIAVGPEEREQVRELIRWFTRRYPSPVERLAYARRAYARWRR
jgi:hypothetical protein